MNKISRVAIVVVICLVVGYVSGMVTRTSITTWYPTLVKPSFNPPNWVFGPVWTTLYVLMGIAMYLIWTQPRTKNRQRALYLNAAQLILNFFWSLIFFNLHAIGMSHCIGLFAELAQAALDTTADIDEGEVAQLARGVFESLGQL